MSWSSMRGIGKRPRAILQASRAPAATSAAATSAAATTTSAGAARSAPLRRAEGVGAAGGCGAVAGGFADDDFHVLIQAVAAHFGHEAVGDSGHDGDRPEVLAFAHPDGGLAPFGFSRTRCRLRGRVFTAPSAATALG